MVTCYHQISRIVKFKRKMSILIIYLSLKFCILVRYLYHRQISDLSLKCLYYFSNISDICKKSSKTFLSLSATDIPFKLICYLSDNYIRCKYICYLREKKHRLFPMLSSEDIFRIWPLRLKSLHIHISKSSISRSVDQGVSRRL